MRYIKGHAYQCVQQISIDVQMTFVLRYVAFAMRLIEHPPQLWWQAHCVLETLEDRETVLRAVTVPSKCSH